MKNIIDRFTLDKENAVIAEIVMMDPTLSLFFEVTGYAPDKLPDYVADVVKQVLQVENFDKSKIVRDFKWKEIGFLE